MPFALRLFPSFHTQSIQTITSPLKWHAENTRLLKCWCHYFALPVDGSIFVTILVCLLRNDQQNDDCGNSNTKSKILKEFLSFQTYMLCAQLMIILIQVKYNKFTYVLKFWSYYFALPVDSCILEVFVACLKCPDRQTDVCVYSKIKAIVRLLRYCNTLK